MGDVGDFWRDVKNYKRDKKRTYQNNHMAKDVEKLRAVAVKIDEKNNGQHLIINLKTIYGTASVDFYPSTGLWNRRGGGKATGYGANSLISYFKPVSNKGE